MNEQITLGAKEKTALSILLGLRQKFAREYRKYPREYSSLELYKVFSEMLNKIKSGSMIFSKSNTQTKKVDVKSYAKEFE